MSEKRFVHYDVGNDEIRYGDDKIFHFLWEVAPFLNEQQAISSALKEENEELKQRIALFEQQEDEFEQYTALVSTLLNELVDKVDEQQAISSALKEENEELRQFINKGRRLSVKELMDNVNENELLKEKIKGLEKENEKMKKRFSSYEMDEDEVDQRDYSLCIDCRHQNGTWVSDREVDTWCTIKKGIDCDEVFECDDYEAR